MKHGLTILFLFVCFWSLGQEESNRRTKKISTQGDTIQLDSLSVAPGSIVLAGVDSNDYFIDYANGQLIWINNPAGDSVQVEYRTWPINLTTPISHKDAEGFRPDQSGQINPFSYRGNNPPSPQFGGSKLEKSGNISRGMLFGNNQNLGVNSNLNLQLSGELSEKVKIKAVISDNNIPVQADGNTQLLQDFDQVFIQLYHDNWKLIAGDFRIKDPNSHFMTFDKRLRGGGFTTKFPVKGKATNQLSVNAALSRGKFARNIIQGTEGSQGPYRLTGAENESFIIILSGTEVVYIDGKKLQRGQENDYVIDYNKAEIVFTAKQPITKDKRIVVEFQYSAQSYGRSLINVSNYYTSEKWRLNFNLYSEQDSKNQPLLQDLTDENIQLMESIGNDIDQAIVSSVRSVDYSNDRVLYKQIQDSITGDTIYVYSTNPDSARYQLTFSNVGAGNGDYVEIQSSANGRVFEYVAPVGGQRQGTHLPVILLVTPKKKQMFTVGGDYSLTKYSKLLFEVAYTEDDQNTFSDIGNSANKGGGFLLGWQRTKQITNDTVAPWFMDAKVTYENRSDNFGEIQRYRSVEFDRNWNIRDQTLTGMQHVPEAQLSFRKKKLGSVSYQLKSFISGDSYQGLRNQLTSQLDNKKFTANVIGSMLFSEGSLGSTEFIRHKALLQKKYEGINIGFRDDQEYNLKRPDGSEILDSTSYSFFEWEVFIANGDSAKNKFKVGYIRRTDSRANDNQIKEITLGQSIVGSLSLVSNPKAKLNLSSQYRVLEVKDSTLYDGDPDQTFTNRIDYSFRLWRGLFALSSFYEVGSGLVEEQSFIYVEVPNGTGTYAWIDYNGNGIAEQNEFEIAQFQDQANYIRVLAQTNKFEKIYRTQFNQSLFFRPAAIWSSKKGIRKVLSKVSNQVAYRIDRKTSDNSLAVWLDPFATNFADSTIRNMNSSFRNTVYLNRSSKYWSIDYTYQDVNTKNIQSNGLIGTQDVFHQVNFRYNMTRIYQINIEGKEGRKNSGSDFFSNRNYQINYSSFKPSLTYLQGSGVQIKFFYEQIQQENLAELGGETNVTEKYGMELNVRKVGKGSFLLTGTYQENDFTGDINSPIAYQMLEGLQPGRNGVWEITYRRNIAKNLQLNLRYNGRVSEGNPVIHTGNVQVRAFF